MQDDEAGGTGLRLDQLGQGVGERLDGAVWRQCGGGLLKPFVDGGEESFAPGVLFLKPLAALFEVDLQEPGTWAQLMPEQRERLTALGVQGAALPLAATAPAELRPELAAALKGPRKPGSKAEAAFQRGLAALPQWVEKEGQRADGAARSWRSRSTARQSRYQ
ncbi:hypothetical protein ACFVP0_24300 [Streptomyces cinereoruber]|uniref:hypothetical protein n=1 Tax=Streptomyces cinereoruber TaxID=67260 RepID=UPI0036C621A3